MAKIMASRTQDGAMTWEWHGTDDEIRITRNLLEQSNPEFVRFDALPVQAGDRLQIGPFLLEAVAWETPGVLRARRI